MRKLKRQMMRLHEVLKTTGLSKATIYRLMKENRFPKQKQIGLRAVAWFEDEIAEWQTEVEVAA